MKRAHHVEREGAPSGRGGQPSVGEWLPPLPLSQIMTSVERWECEGVPPLKRLAAPYGSAPPLKRGTPLPWHMLKNQTNICPLYRFDL
jgi:hypothetical protein